jgi:hypothetical protein
VYTRSTAIEEVERHNDVPTSFLRFAAAHIPRSATFGVVTGPEPTSAIASFAQWELLPRIEETDQPCTAGWLLFVDHAPTLNGVDVGRVLRFGQRMSVAKVVRRCAR